MQEEISSQKWMKEQIMSKITENDQNIFRLQIERLYIENAMLSARNANKGLLFAIENKRNHIFHEVDIEMLKIIKLGLKYYSKY